RTITPSDRCPDTLTSDVRAPLTGASLQHRLPDVLALGAARWMTNTAEPIGAVHWLSRSRSDRRCWIGRNCLSRPGWNDTKICPASETAAEPAGGGTS